MDATPSFPWNVDSSRKWSLYAGLYMFICGTVVSLLLSDLLSLLADVIGLQTGFWMVILASPVLVIGAVVWWALIERYDSYTYRRGIVFGLLTALLTGLLWTIQFILVWGVEMAEIPIIAFFIVLVLGLTAIAGVLAGIPLMYARHRLDKTVSGETDHPV